MERVYTYTRTSTTEPEDNNTVVSSLDPPTRDEILAQLEEHFYEHIIEGMVTSEDVKKIADTISNAFDELREKPYGGFAKYCPQKPMLTIIMYHDEWTLFDRERYPGDYSPLEIIPIKGDKIDFSMTIIENTKRISLAYVG